MAQEKWNVDLDHWYEKKDDWESSFGPLEFEKEKDNTKVEKRIIFRIISILVIILQVIITFAVFPEFSNFHRLNEVEYSLAGITFLFVMLSMLFARTDKDNPKEKRRFKIALAIDIAFIILGIVAAIFNIKLISISYVAIPFIIIFVIIYEIHNIKKKHDLYKIFNGNEWISINAIITHVKESTYIEEPDEDNHHQTIVHKMYRPEWTYKYEGKEYDADELGATTLERPYKGERKQIKVNPNNPSEYLEPSVIDKMNYGIYFVPILGIFEIVIYIILIKFNILI